MVKNLPAMWETWVQSLGQEDPLEESWQPNSSVLAWEIPWTEEPGKFVATVYGGAESDMTERLTLSLLTLLQGLVDISSALVVVAQSPSHVRLFATPWTAASQGSLSLTTSQSLPKFMPTASVIHSDISSSDALFSFCPESFPASGTSPIKSAVHIRWPKYWNLGFSIIPPNTDYSELTSLKTDWFDLPAVQGTFTPAHSSKASVLWHSAFFTVQLSQPYMTSGKNIALTIRTFVDRVTLTFLLFNLQSLGLSQLSR